MHFKCLLPLVVILIFYSVTCKAQDYKELGYYVKDSTRFDTYPTFPGGEKKLRKYTHADFYNSTLYKKVFYHTKTTGFIFVTYSLDSTGIVSNPVIDMERVAFDKKKTDMTQVDSIKQEVTDKLIDVFNRMPQWSPAVLNGKRVSTTLVSPIYLVPW